MRRRRRTSRGRAIVAQRPRNSGWRLARKAATASMWSLLGRAGAGPRLRRRAPRRAAAATAAAMSPLRRGDRRASGRRRGGRPARRRRQRSSAASTTCDTMPHSRSLLGGERLAEKDQLAGPGRPDRPHEGGRQSRVARQPDRRERRRQPGAGGGDAQVARQGEAEPGPDARPVDRRQHRFRHRRQGRDDRGVVLLDRGERRSRILVERGGVLGEVLSGAEGAAGTGDRRRRAPRRQSPASVTASRSCGLQLDRQGVAPIGTVEGDRRDRAGAVDEQTGAAPLPSDTAASYDSQGA